jgi:Mg-chelatase subunit ChlD
MFVRLLRTGMLICGVVASPATSAFAQNSGCWFPLTLEVVGEHPSLQKLSEKNVAVRVGGRARKVSGIDLQMATQLIVVLDTSGSMHSHGWKGLGVLVNDLLLGAPASVKKVGLTTFSEAAVHANGREDSLKLLNETMQRGAYGRTRLLDTLLDSARYFQAGANTVMIVITDGGDTRSLNSSKDDRRELLRRGVRTTFILTQNEKPGTVEEMLDDLPRELADATGGNTIHFDHIPENANHILGPDATRKLLEFYRVEIPTARGKLKIGLEDDLRKRAKDLKVHYPREVNCEAGIALR